MRPAWLAVGLLLAACRAENPAYLPAAARPDVASGLVGWWTMDEGAGTRVADSSGNRNDGTLAGGARTAGKAGNAVAIAGAGQVVVPRSPTLDGITSAVSITAWVQLAEAQDVLQWVATRQLGDTIAEHYGLGVLAGRLQFTCSTVGRFLSPTAFPIGRWTHVAGVYDGRHAWLYMDGVPAGDGDLAGTLAADTTPLLLGANQDPDGITGHLLGALDDVRLYARALTPAQVAALAGVSP